LPIRAGIRELRQYLSRYVERVKAGETVEVTERGRLVAALVPRAAEDPLAGLEERGLHLTRATVELAGVSPTPKRRRGARPLTEVLAEQRERERY